jgi:hypothetical protein
MCPLMFSVLANLRADGGGGVGTGPFLFPMTRGDLGGAVRKELTGVSVYTSTQVSNTRAKNAGANLTYILIGNFLFGVGARGLRL